MPAYSQRNLIVVLKIIYNVRWLFAAIIFLISSGAGADLLESPILPSGWSMDRSGSPRIGNFQKYNIDPELALHRRRSTVLASLDCRRCWISFTAGGATVAANLSGSDVVLLGASIDSLPFELWSIPSIKQPEQLKGTKLGISRIGATTDFVARYLLKKWGLRPDKDVPVFQPAPDPNSSPRSKPAKGDPWTL